jgi:MFS family permease
VSLLAGLRHRLDGPESALNRWLDRTTPLGTLRRAHVLSMAADATMTVALAGSLFFSVSPDEARSRIALYLLFTMAPFAALSPLVAPFIDRSRQLRRAMVVISALVRMVAVLAMAALLGTWLLFPLALVALVASKAYLITKSSLVPEVVSDPSPRTLVQTNASLTLLASVGGALGVTVGAILVRTPHLGPPWALIAEPIFLLYMLAEGVRLARMLHERGDGGLARGSAGARLRSRPTGIGYARTLLASLLVAVLRGQVGFFAFVIAFALKGRGAPAWAYAAALAASALGAAASTQVAPRLRRHLSEVPIAIGAAGLVAVIGIAAVEARPAVPWGIAVMGVLSLAAGSAKIAFDATVQRGLREEHYGRTFARYETVFQLAWVLGAAAATFARTPLGSGESLIGTTATVALAAYTLATAAVRHAQEADAQAET